jgi:hypothetical protein
MSRIKLFEVYDNKIDIAQIYLRSSLTNLILSYFFKADQKRFSWNCFTTSNFRKINDFSKHLNKGYCLKTLT